MSDAVEVVCAKGVPASSACTARPYNISPDLRALGDPIEETYHLAASVSRRRDPSSYSHRRSSCTVVSILIHSPLWFALST